MKEQPSNHHVYEIFRISKKMGEKNMIPFHFNSILILNYMIDYFCFELNDFNLNWPLNF